MAEKRDEVKIIPTVYIVREVYDNENALEAFELELERGLESECDLIIIEPTRLGEETARWISVGNCLHKTATLSGLGSITSSLVWTDKPYISAPLCILSLLCTGVYTLSWQFDPCVNYQFRTNHKRLVSEYPMVESLLASTHVVLVRKDMTRRHRVHTGVSLIAAVVCMWRLWEAFK